MDRSNTTGSGGKYAVKESDYQPEELDDAFLEDMSNIGYVYPRDIKLLSKEKLKCRKIP